MEGKRGRRALEKLGQDLFEENVSSIDQATEDRRRARESFLFVF